MTIEVLLFAQLREAVGTDRIEMHFDDGARVSDIIATLQTQHALPDLPLRAAVNATFTETSHVLSDGDRVALLTPASGG